MHKSYEELLKDTFGYKSLELHYAVCQFKYEVIVRLPLPKNVKALLLRKEILNLFVIDKAMKDYLK